MNDRKKKNKIVAASILGGSCVIAAIGLLFLNSDLTFDFKFDSKKEDTAPVQYVYDGSGVHRVSLYEPDWTSDIFENQAYLDLNRYIAYVEGGMTVTITDGNFGAYGEGVAFFADYIDALQNGDADRLNAFYSDAYREENGEFGPITMQKLYNIRVEYLSSVTDDGNRSTKWYYKLTYMIMENDGTFRPDIPSDAEKPQFYELTDDGRGLIITDVASSYQNRG